MYQGHHQDGSGVQKHSAGGLYPYTIAFRERADGKGGFIRTHIVLGPKCTKGFECPTYDEAERAALSFRDGSQALGHNQRQWSRYAASRR